MPIMDLHKESYDVILNHMGKVFECERIYLFEKNERGSYDCTVEWCAEQVVSKKTHLQNLSAEAVGYYYYYFQKSGKLMIRHIEDLQEEDPSLYMILTPQGVRSTMVAHLVYEGEDLGFVGIDNPSSETFDQLEAVLETVCYLLSVLLKSQKMLRNI